MVDDNVDAAESLALLLTLDGQNVRVAFNGPRALTAASDFLPELIFLDLGMPGMDGYEVARRLRARPELRGTLLVALTGWSEEDDRQRSYAAGFDHHLVKPAEPDKLRALLDLLRPPSAP